MKMFLISDNVDSLTGMRLAGIKGVVVHEKKEILKAFEDVFKDEEIQIVLITEKLVDIVPDYILDIRLNRKYPLIVEIPDRHGSKKPPDSILKFIEDSMGLKS
ncbi:V-type ATP synthase subunit F [Herbivorax sp. ANBcel31]|uniref:V-type ATP synthase subunit F n=1 Tax=Herbivorax sp. ANBcel31 TaxID=3069754 RepID=UPI0027B29334|nr:V-type ATP synthase subunit F [Herbivorax sp. ANBcel31]MDQ2087261.1 V-type ATP synthase subunit F [Herbivorax sp. ANBcel31]